MTLRNAISVPTTEKGQMADSNYNKAHLHVTLSLPNGGSLGEAGITLIETSDAAPFSRRPLLISRVSPY
jgi:hypothetical protein